MSGSLTSRPHEDGWVRLLVASDDELDTFLWGRTKPAS